MCFDWFVCLFLMEFQYCKSIIGRNSNMMTDAFRIDWWKTKRTQMLTLKTSFKFSWFHLLTDTILSSQRFVFFSWINCSFWWTFETNHLFCVIVQGGWEDDETVLEAASREAMEEAGVKGILRVCFFFFIKSYFLNRFCLDWIVFWSGFVLCL